MEEQWERWKPIDGLARKYDIADIIDDVDGFVVTLFDISDKHQRLILQFQHSVEAYHVANETLRHRVIVDLDTRYGTEFYGNWTFFIVTHSSYIRWLSKQSCTISDGMELVHYSILAANAVLDIAAISQPIVYLKAA